MLISSEHNKVRSLIWYLAYPDCTRGKNLGAQEFLRATSSSLFDTLLLRGALVYGALSAHGVLLQSPLSRGIYTINPRPRAQRQQSIIFLA